MLSMKKQLNMNIMNVGKRYIVGDIHGEHDKLIKCLQSVNFDYENDTLIQLGDIIDRGEKSYECVEELLKIKNLIAIRGNHDECFMSGLHTGIYSLFGQGARETIISYMKSCTTKRELNVKMSGHISDFNINDFPLEHYKFFQKQVPYYILDDKLFVHGGFNRHYLIDDPIHNGEEVLFWDRDLIAEAKSWESMVSKTPFKNKNNFKEIYVGHTPVQYFVRSDKPQRWANVNLLDTGCGKRGVLTIMDLDTHEYKQF